MIGNGLEVFARHKPCKSYLTALCAEKTTSVDKDAPRMSFIYFRYDSRVLGTGQEPAVNPGKDVQCHPGLCQQKQCQELRAGLVASA